MKRLGAVLGIAILAGWACKTADQRPGDCNVAQSHVIHVQPDCSTPNACDPAKIEKHNHHTVRWIAPRGQTIRVTMPDPAPDRPFEGLNCQGGECSFPCDSRGSECWAKVDEGFHPAEAGSPFRYNNPACSRSIGGGDPGMIIFK